MKKFLKLIFAACMVACFLLFPIFMGNAPASAEEVAEPPVTDETTDKTETVEDDLKSLVDGFIEQLKTKYGDDYETYYNAIIGQWGSVEEYLLSLVTEDTPDAVASGWTAFVKWLGEYSPVWGSIFAVVAVIIVVLLGKKALNKVTGFVMGTGSKFKTLFSEINKIDAALNAQSKALVKLLGENEKFKEERAELEKTAEDLSDDKL